MRVILNIVWLVFGGLLMALGYVLVGLLCYLTIIGIPLGLASFKIVPISLFPLGSRIVPIV